MQPLTHDVLVTFQALAPCAESKRSIEDIAFPTEPDLISKDCPRIAVFLAH